MATIQLDDFDDVEDLALEMGATVEYPGGRKFNTSQSVGVRKPRVSTPAPQPKPAPPAPDNTAILQQLVAQLAAQMSAANSRPINVTLPELPAPQVTVTPLAAKPTSWAFEFERNPNGTIKRINATAVG